MDIKRILVILILAIVLVSAINTIYAEDRSYSITNAEINLTVDDNGLLHVVETYTYSFDGTYNGVYRDIPLYNGENIKHFYVYVDGAYGSPEITEDDEGYHVKVYLWADRAHTSKIHDQEVVITYTYDMENVVTFYNDIASLQYKLWDKTWDVNVEKLTANIILPGNTNNIYFLNPDYYTKSNSSSGNTIHIETNNIPSEEFYEIEILMPLDDFSNGTYASHIDANGKEEIIKNQEAYRNDINFWGSLFNGLSILLVISPLSLILVYIKYGREPKVDYDGIYERELPTDDPPAVVNALIENNHAIGKPNMKGFEATIMDLINRKVFKIHTEEGNSTNELILEFDDDKYDGLAKHEKRAFDTMQNFSKNGLLNVSRLSSQLNNETSGKYFKKQLDNWEYDVVNEYLGDDKVSEYFNGTGSTIHFLFAVLGIIISLISIFYISNLSNQPAAFYLRLAAIFLLVVSFSLFFIPEDIFGQWTPKGRVYYLKWTNFKKFLTDYSLIKEHPPESIAIWNQYLVYGTALGVADEVYESMKLYKPNMYDDDHYHNDLYTFHSYAGLSMMHSAFDTGISAANPSSDGGGFGSVGGGSGGGGGGAF